MTRSNDGMTIYIDVDDVLAHTSVGLVDLLHRTYGKQVEVEAIREFDLRKSFGLTEDEHDRLLDLAHEDEFILGLRSMPHAAATLRSWRERGWRLEIMTGRSPGSIPATARWLDQASIPYDDLCAVDKYGRHGGHPDSLSMQELESRSYDVAIEDSLPMALSLARHVERVCLVDRPWNQGSAERPLPDAVTRVADWEAIATRIVPRGTRQRS